MYLASLRQHHQLSPPPAQHQHQANFGTFTTDSSSPQKIVYMFGRLEGRVLLPIVVRPGATLHVHTYLYLVEGLLHLHLQEAFCEIGKSDCCALGYSANIVVHKFTCIYFVYGKATAAIISEKHKGSDKDRPLPNERRLSLNTVRRSFQDPTVNLLHIRGDHCPDSRLSKTHTHSEPRIPRQ